MNRRFMSLLVSVGVGLAAMVLVGSLVPRQLAQENAGMPPAVTRTVAPASPAPDATERPDAPAAGPGGPVRTGTPSPVPAEPPAVSATPATPAGQAAAEVPRVRPTPDQPDRRDHPDRPGRVGDEPGRSTASAAARPRPPAPRPPAPPAPPRADPRAATTCRTGTRPYSDDSPWNTPIGAAPQARTSGQPVNRLAGLKRPLTSDTEQYTPALHRVSGGNATVRLSGFFSDYRSGKRVGGGSSPVVTGVPIPNGTVAGAGSDGQVILWDQRNQIEWGFWQFRPGPNGTYTATNGYVASTGCNWPGLFPDGKAGRGGGLPYLGGLVTEEELKAGRIEHALAFAYGAPAKTFVHPATKSDGRGQGSDLPEGTRLQLNPALTEAQLRGMGLSSEAIVLARAMQTYGMYVVDNSGSSKIYLEDTATADWPRGVTRDMVSGLPWDQFRVVTPPGR